MSFPTLPGVFTASLTPLNEKLEPDLKVLLDHAFQLLNQGSDGVALLGSTGEANSLTLEQRITVIENTAANLPVDRLMFGTGSCSLQDAVRLTHSSLEAGVLTVLVLPPFYYRPQSEEGAFRFYSELIETVADDRLRLVFYNFPQLTGYTFSLNLLLRLRERYGIRAAGIKDSSGDWKNMNILAREIPNFSVYAGTERYLLDLLREGGAGCITATGNLTSPTCQEVYRAWRSGQQVEANKVQHHLTLQRLALQQRPFVPGMKALLSMSTGKAGWRNMLPPFVPLSEAETKAFATEVTETGLKIPFPS